MEKNREIFTSILSVTVEPPIASTGRGRDAYYWDLFRDGETVTVDGDTGTVQYAQVG